MVNLGELKKLWGDSITIDPILLYNALWEKGVTMLMHNIENKEAQSSRIFE